MQRSIPVLRRSVTRSARHRLQKIPYMLVVGAKEEEEGKVSVRSRFLGDEGAKDLDEFITSIKAEIKSRENRKVEVQEEKK